MRGAWAQKVRLLKFSFSENLMTAIESAAGGGRTSLIASEH
jgi:hypothetical protein